MKRLLKGLSALIVLVLLGGSASFLWAKSAAAAQRGRIFDTHRVDFPIPTPLTEGELAQLRAERGGELAGVDLEALATERARERGQHLVRSRYPCTECHGKDFGGAPMVDSPAIGRFFGLNLTSGEGGVVSQYTAADWDRAVRHGVLPDGRPSMMPSVDFASMSDQELSDIVTYLRSLPPVDHELPRPVLRGWPPSGRT